MRTFRDIENPWDVHCVNSPEIAAGSGKGPNVPVQRPRVYALSAGNRLLYRFILAWVSEFTLLTPKGFVECSMSVKSVFICAGLIRTNPLDQILQIPVLLMFGARLLRLPRPRPAVCHARLSPSYRRRVRRLRCGQERGPPATAHQFHHHRYGSELPFF